MNKKITFFDKIFSFRESVIRQYIENELSDYTDQINFKKDIIRRHWMFFFLKSFHIFLLIGFFIFALSFILKYQSFLHQTLLKGNYGINLTIGFLSSLIIFGFIIYIIKAKLINKIGIFIGFFISIKNIIYTIPEKVSQIFIIDKIFITASILLFIFFIEIILKSLKIIYDVLVDYKNDFIVIYPEGLYISEKEGALYHSAQRIIFDEIVDVSSKEKGFFGTFFGFGELKISIMGTGEDYEFRYCKNITKVPIMLNEKRIKYVENKKMRGKKMRKKRKEIIFPECKPFKSRLRNDLIKILNLKGN